MGLPEGLVGKYAPPGSAGQFEDFFEIYGHHYRGTQIGQLPPLSDPTHHVSSGNRSSIVGGRAWMTVFIYFGLEE